MELPEPVIGLYRDSFTFTFTIFCVSAFWNINALKLITELSDLAYENLKMGYQSNYVATCVIRSVFIPSFLTQLPVSFRFSGLRITSFLVLSDL
jgi:hypothetical protein